VVAAPKGGPFRPRPILDDAAGNIVERVLNTPQVAQILADVAQITDDLRAMTSKARQFVETLLPEPKS
jgi:hypothetical protein